MRKITISGNVGNDPQINTTQSGMEVANFSLAVRKDRPDDQGNYGTDWFRCSVWGKRAQTIQNYFHKGDHVLVTGSLEVGEYNGNVQLNVNVDDFYLPSRQSGNQQSNGSTMDPFANAGTPIDIDDDDLPF